MSQPNIEVIKEAVFAADSSPCRSQRGAAIWDCQGFIAAGFNYKPTGFPCDHSDACKASCRFDAIHAEQCAIMGALRSQPGRLVGASMLHVKVVNGMLVPSGPPSCVKCSTMIVASGIGFMWLYHETGWRMYSAHEFHRLSGAYVAGGKP